MIERAHSGQGTRSADAACIALVVAEVAGTALMWAAVPFLWLLVFFVWYYALSRAFIIPFMPSR
jgi:hypothetical protein